MLSWIQAFLGNRSQQVVIDGEESDSIPVNSGVPQGSVLGLILFLTYINDLPGGISSQVPLFADDTALYLTIKGEEDSSALQTDLDTLSVWESKWDMQFNPSKCQVVQVTGSKSKKPINSEYILHGLGDFILICILSLVRPQLEYASAVWDLHTKERILSLKLKLSSEGLLAGLLEIMTIKHL